MAEASSAEAILFFDKHQIIKQMNYAEFQSILDCYVPLHDIANRLMDAVYLRINNQLHVTAAVFFKIDFDEQGYVEKSWNIPLQQLADNAAKGPNLGSGPIALACYSQCPLEWHRNNLWDPLMQASQNDIALIKKAIKNNVLGFIFKDKSKDESADSYSEERTRAALLIKEQRLKQKLLATKAEQDMRQLSLDHQERLLSYQQQINDYQSQINEHRAINLELQETVAKHEDKITGMREYFEHKLEMVKQSGSGENEDLKEFYREEMDIAINSLRVKLNAELEAKEVELLYRSERESQLKQELVKLQEDNKCYAEASAQTSNQDILDKLNNAGVTCVIYHPGAGHLTIKTKDVLDYLSNPTAYVARACGVNEHLYKVWLDHFYSPSCQYQLENGETCDKPLKRLDDPSQFIIGESDCCLQHQNKTNSIVNISKNGRKELNFSNKQ